MAFPAGRYLDKSAFAKLPDVAIQFFKILSSMSDKIDTESFKQFEKLRELRVNLRDMDYLIDSLSHDPTVDQLRIRRLKKRRLIIKDMISRLESELIPDMDA